MYFILDIIIASVCINFGCIDIVMIKEAMHLMSDKDDFEDILQYICALHSHCTVIITNDKNFYRGEIELRSLK